MKFIRKFAAWLMLAAAFLAPMEVAYANSPSQAFSSLLSGASASVNSPGSFSSQARHVFSGGGLDVHFPRDSVQLISITPPSFSIGCGGISLHMGGLSFVSGAQISQMVQQISQAAMGYVINLALKTLCPSCEAVLSAMQKLAQFAAKSSIDSCKMGTELGEKMAGLFNMTPDGGDSDAQQAQCGKTAANPANNQSANFLQAIAVDACNGINAVTDKLDKMVGSGSDADKQKYASVYGNTTWQALNGMGYLNQDDKEFIMSLVGTVVRVKSQQPDAAGNYNANPKPYPPMVNAHDALYMFMCGANNSSNADVVNMCKQLAGDKAIGSMTDIYQCDTADNCYSPKTVSYTQSGFFSSMGFLDLVVTLLDGAVHEVQQNQPLDAQSIQLINTAPFPLYQMINIAAVYPDIAQQMVDNNSLLVATLMAQAFFSKVINGSARSFGGGDADTHAVADMRKELDGLEQKMKSQLQKNFELYALQDSLINNIQRVNREIQSHVISQGLVGNTMFATGIMRNITAGK